MVGEQRDGNAAPGAPNSRSLIFITHLVKSVPREQL